MVWGIRHCRCWPVPRFPPSRLVFTKQQLPLKLSQPLSSTKITPCPHLKRATCNDMPRLPSELQEWDSAPSRSTFGRCNLSTPRYVLYSRGPRGAVPIPAALTCPGFNRNSSNTNSAASSLGNEVVTQNGWFGRGF